MGLTFLSALPAFFGDYFVSRVFGGTSGAFLFSAITLILAAACALVNLRLSGIKEIYARFRGILLFLAVFLIALSIPMILRWSGNIPQWEQSAVLMLRIIGAMLMFLLTVVYGTSYPAFSRWLIALFLIPIAIAPVLVIAPQIFRDPFLVNEGRFAGWAGTPMGLGMFMLFPVVWLTSLLYVRGSRWKPILFLFLVVTLAALIGSGSRGAWLGALIALIALFALQRRAGKTASIPLTVAMLFAAALLAFSILPCRAKLGILARVERIASVSFYSVWGEGEAECREAFSGYARTVTSAGSRFSAGADRIALWSQALHYFAADPSGYGPAYFRMIDLTYADIHGMSAHNIFLAAALSGGMLLLGLMLYFYYWIGRRIRGSRPATWHEAAVYSAFIGQLIQLQFIDGLDIRFFWILAAVAIVLLFRRHGDAERQI